MDCTSLLVLVKLINIAPIKSKKGADVTSVCYETLKMNGKIKNSELKKIVGLTGDGAFAKLNKPFKNERTELLGKMFQLGGTYYIL